MIYFEGVSLKIQDRFLLKDIHLKISHGEKVVVLGPSGSGKSTLLNCLLGLHTLTSGQIIVGDKRISPENIFDIRSELAYVGQEPFLGAEKVEEALLLPFQYKSHRKSLPEKEQIIHILQKLRLKETILVNKTRNISGGEKQRLAVARALLLKKRIFILDEVTSALDKESTEALLDLLSNKEYTMLSVSHDPRWIDTCNSRYEMNEGRLSLNVTKGVH